MNKEYTFEIISKLHLSATVVILVIGTIFNGNEIKTYLNKQTDIEDLKIFRESHQEKVSKFTSKIEASSKDRLHPLQGTK